MTTLGWDPFRGEVSKDVTVVLATAGAAMWRQILQDAYTLGLPCLDSPALPGSDLERITTAMDGAPVPTWRTITRSLTTAMGTLSMALTSLKGSEVEVSAEALSSLTRAALLAAGHVYAVLAPVTHEERLDAARTLAAGEWKSLQRYLSFLEGHSDRDALHPGPEQVARWKEGAAALGLKDSRGEQSLLDGAAELFAAEIPRLVQERLVEGRDHRADQAELMTTSRETPGLIFHLASGSAHSWAWPDVVPRLSELPHDQEYGHLGFALTMTHDAFDLALTRCGRERVLVDHPQPRFVKTPEGDTRIVYDSGEEAR